MKFRQHVITDGDNFEFEVKTFAEILKSKLFQDWSNKKNFYRFCVTPSTDSMWSKSTIICELDKGQEWWILGHTDFTPEQTGLPVWKAK